MTIGERFPVGPAVLGYLLEGPAHGYELGRRMRQDLGRIWRVAPSQLYVTLDRLERQGLIQGMREEQESRPPRIRYSLTAEGEAEFRAWVTSPVPRVRLLRSELLPKLFFLFRLSPEKVPSLLCAQKEALLSLEAHLSREQPEPGFPTVLHSFRLSQVRASLSWLDSLLAELGKETQCEPSR